MINNATDETDFPHKVVLTDRKLSKLCKAFAYNFSANINLSKAQIAKVTQLGELLEQVMIVGLPLIKI